MAGTSPQLTRMEVELLAVALTLVGGLEGAAKEKKVCQNIIVTRAIITE